MPTARSKQIDYNVTPYYHCYVRCVRKGYLFGKDERNKNYDHRKQWIEDRLKYLSQGFAINICAYAVMTNHYHVVLQVNVDEALSWSDEEVIQRLRHVTNTKKEYTPTPEQVVRWRDNLSSISWFMRYMNEHIARKANIEDEVTGRFWEGRFKSQALVEEGALLACMAYVDLNPIRAKVASTLENSEHTSIQERIRAYQENQSTPETLAPFQTPESQQTNSLDKKMHLPFALKEYVELVEWTGRQIREDKPGFISSDVPSIVQAFGLNPQQWMQTATTPRKSDPSIVGTLLQMRTWAKKIGQRWLRGQNKVRMSYLTAG